VERQASGGVDAELDMNEMEVRNEDQVKQVQSIDLGCEPYWVTLVDLNHRQE
jgi:hypothetical protein